MTCFVGLDVSMEETAYCARNAEGRILGQGKVPTDPDAIAAALARFGRPARVVLETRALVSQAGAVVAESRGAEPGAAGFRSILSSFTHRTYNRRKGVKCGGGGYQYLR